MLGVRRCVGGDDGMSPVPARDCVHRRMFELLPSFDRFALFAPFNSTRLVCLTCDVAWKQTRVGTRCWVCGEPGTGWDEWRQKYHAAQVRS